jgi:hypothetical protein
MPQHITFHKRGLHILTFGEIKALVLRVQVSVANQPHQFKGTKINHSPSPFRTKECETSWKILVKLSSGSIEDYQMKWERAIEARPTAGPISIPKGPQCGIHYVCH